MFCGNDDEYEAHDEDDADEQHYQVPEEESKVANQHRSSVDMTAHPQVIARCTLKKAKKVFSYLQMFRHNQVHGDHCQTSRLPISTKYGILRVGIA